MRDINIFELSPGEAVLSAEKVAQYREALSRGEQLKPIHIFNLNGMKIVRDGNNRVRAYIEHCRASNIFIGKILCVQSSTGEPSPSGRAELREVSFYYGVGESAFLAIPVVTEANYLSTQAEVCRRIREHNSASRV
jgi:hypothetical protein